MKIDILDNKREINHHSFRGVSGCEKSMFSHRFPSIIRRHVSIGIRREQKGKWERRSPIIPTDAELLLKHPNCTGIIVQPSSKRIFSDSEYRQVGCELNEDLSKADIILGIKEVPIDYLLPDKKYMFFSHTHKGQRQNMPMLQTILQRNIHLMDYELLVDGKSGQRLVAFGKHAGYAGMINIIHGLGNRLLSLGYSTPLLHVSRAYNYYALDEAKASVHMAGQRISNVGFPEKYSPIVFAFTGSGNVAQGAHEVFRQFPNHQYLTLKELQEKGKSNQLNNKTIYGVEVQLEDYLSHTKTPGQKFDSAEYFQHGKSRYTSGFAQKVLPYITCLVHGSYWDARYPRILTTDEMNQHLTSAADPKLLAIADISCDLSGPLEFMDRASTIDDPFFFYNAPKSKREGVMIMSIDNLPAELSTEASHHFSKCLKPLMLDFFEGKSDLLDQASIAKNGKVVERYHKTVLPSLASAQQAKKRKVLLLGSGRVALPIIDHFIAKNDVELTVASNSEKELSVIDKLSRKPGSAHLMPVDVTNQELLGPIIREHDVVISFVPAFMHSAIAKSCITHKRNLVTASYLSPEIAQLDAAAKEAGITILNELGLDPGIDHLLALEYMDRVKEAGGQITSFVSWCGGLPAPENSDNPLGYKFSWSPRGVLTAAMNPALYKMNSQIVEIEAGDILNTPLNVDIFKGFNFQGLPNRDSMKYVDIYKLDANRMKNMFRGTLRYKGFAEVMRVIRDVGLLDQKAIVENGDRSWADVTSRLLKHKTLERVLEKSMTHEHAGEKVKLTEALEYLGLFDPNEPVMSTKSGMMLDSLSLLLERKLKYEDGQRDMVCLHHTFVANDGVNAKIETKHTTGLVAYGEVGGYTAMAKTVALPAAYGADLLLDGAVSRKGAILPVDREIYEPILKRLRAQMFFAEKTSRQ